MRRSSPYFVFTAAQLVDDDLHQQPLAGENRAQPLDRLQQLGELVEDLLPLEAGQALQLHVEDGLRLNLRQAEARSSGPRAPRARVFEPRISVITASR